MAARTQTDLPAQVYDTDIALAAALIADPTRAAILHALTPGRPLAAGELARLAGVSAGTASFHLTKLLDGGMVAVTQQGRHRYYQLPGHEVATALEALGLISPGIPARSLRQSREAEALAEARTCYDHLAGRAGVELLDALRRGGFLTRAGTSPARYEVSGAGREKLMSFGVNIEEVGRTRRHFAGECLDWTERRGHLNGALAAAITTRLFALGWIEHGRRRRSVVVTASGADGLAATFGWAASAAPPSPEMAALAAADLRSDLAQERTALGEDATGCNGVLAIGPGVRVLRQPGPVPFVIRERAEVDERQRVIVRALLRQVVTGQLAAAALDDGRPGGGVLLEVVNLMRVKRVLNNAGNHVPDVKSAILRPGSKRTLWAPGAAPRLSGMTPC